MNPERETRILLDRWLSEGPTQAPDRILDAVTDRIERRAQRPAWGFLWREVHPSARLKPLAGAAAALLVLGAALVVLGPPSLSSSGITSLPTPTPPSPTPIASAAPTSIASPANVASPGGSTSCNTADWSGCAGPIASGPHSIGAPLAIPMTYTVPAGWQIAGITETEFDLAAPGTVAGTGNGSWLRVLLDPYAVSRNPDCSWRRDPLVTTGSTRLIGWLRAEPGIVAGVPKAIPVAGYQAEMLDVGIAPGSKGACSGPATLTVPLFTNVRADTIWGLSGPQKARLIFLETGAWTVLVAIDSSDPTNFEQLVREVMPIVDSLTFPAH